MIAEMTLKEAGRIIDNAMKLKGYTQKDVESGCGVDQSSISKMIRGIRGPGIDSYNRVCEYLEIVLMIRFPTISEDPGPKENS